MYSIKCTNVKQNKKNKQIKHATNNNKLNKFYYINVILQCMKIMQSKISLCIEISLRIKYYHFYTKRNLPLILNRYSSFELSVKLKGVFSNKTIT